VRCYIGGCHTPADHTPCCSAHGSGHNLCHAHYRSTHHVEVCNCGRPACKPADPVSVEYGVKYRHADDRITYGVFGSRVAAERYAKEFSTPVWGVMAVGVVERDVSPWRDAAPVDMSDTRG
jgi:hypothetical protein